MINTFHISNNICNHDNRNFRTHQNLLKNMIACQSHQSLPAQF